MSDDDTNDPGSDNGQAGLTVRASFTSVEASVERGILASIIEFFTGRRKARNILEQGMAVSIATKEARGETPTELERVFVEEVLYAKEYKRRSERAVAMLERADEVQLDMERQMKALPPAGGHTSDEWVSRIIRDAEDITDEGTRDLYARILAGEMARPGTFSLKALTVLRDLERDTARAFEKATKLLINGRYLPGHSGHSDSQELYTGLQLTMNDLISLEESGLLYSTKIHEEVRGQTLSHHGQPFMIEAVKGDGTRISDVSTELKFLALSLTKVGRELATIPVRQLDLDSKRGVANYILDSALASMHPDWLDVTVRWCDVEGGVGREFSPPVTRSFR